MVIGPSFKRKMVDLELSGGKVEWVSKVKYLGVWIQSCKTFRCSSTEVIRKFYGCLNGILRFRTRPSYTVQLCLLMTHCFPVLTYAIEVLKLTSLEATQMKVAYNAIFRKIFGYSKYESVSYIQEFFCYKKWEELVASRSESYLLKKSMSNNEVVHFFARNP